MTWLWIALMGWAVLSVAGAVLIAGGIRLAERCRPRTARFSELVPVSRFPQDAAVAMGRRDAA